MWRDQNFYHAHNLSSSPGLLQVASRAILVTLTLLLFVDWFDKKAIGSIALGLFRVSLTPCFQSSPKLPYAPSQHAVAVLDTALTIRLRCISSQVPPLLAIHAHNLIPDKSSYDSRLIGYQPTTSAANLDIALFMTITTRAGSESSKLRRWLLRRQSGNNNFKADLRGGDVISV